MTSIGIVLDLEPGASAGFVDNVDGLVGQEPVGYVAVGQLDRGHDRLIRNIGRVMLFVAAPEALEYLDGLVERRRVNDDGLEAPLERAVLLYVLPVFVEGGRADRLEFAPRQRRLQHVGRVDGPLGPSGTDDRVQLVDEYDDVVALADLIDEGLEALLELASVLRAGDGRRQVEHDQLLVLERRGHLVGHDLLSQSLDDRRLADSWLADQDRVVLLPPGEHLKHALYLLLPADDRVELVLPGHLREVSAELVERRRLGRAGGPLVRGLPGAAQDLHHLFARPPEIDVDVAKDLRRNALPLPDQRKQKVLRADVLMAEDPRFLTGQLEHSLGTRRPLRFLHRRGVGPARDVRLDHLAYGVEVDGEFAQHGRRDALPLSHDAEKKMLGPEVVVVEPGGFLSSEIEDASDPRCEVPLSLH